MDQNTRMKYYLVNALMHRYKDICLKVYTIGTFIGIRWNFSRFLNITLGNED